MQYKRDDEKRTEYIQIPVTAAEKREIAELASGEGRPVAGYMRDLVVKDKMVKGLAG